MGQTFRGKSHCAVRPSQIHCSRAMENDETKNSPFERKRNLAQVICDGIRNEGNAAFLPGV